MFNQIDNQEIMLSEVQGKVFEKSCELGLDSEKFITAYMNSEDAKNMDMPHHKIRWSGEDYIFHSFLKDNPIPKGDVWDSDVMFWIGYVYRYWNLLTNEKSREIVKIAEANLLRLMYRKYHMENVEFTVDAILNDRPGFKPYRQMLQQQNPGEEQNMPVSQIFSM